MAKKEEICVYLFHQYDSAAFFSTFFGYEMKVQAMNRNEKGTICYYLRQFRTRKSSR